MMIRRLVFVMIFGVAVLGAVPGRVVAAEVGSRVPVPGGAFANVTAPALKKMLEKKDFFFANVHVPYEGEIAKTDAFIPFDQVEKQLHLLPTRKDAKIVLYCMSDRMSTIASETLVRLGYTNIWNLQGGMVEWRKQGYPLISGSGK
ncbi:MAG: rhodanese-like domain-containing protein [candidate division NC10 bacterium]|nr:rhodanese-like domain-containing protein [candidate division NC10 bacterium]MBI3085558.1 rhodanese-like domain-containing protein [candidate division NC10 bacterium]